MRRIVAVKQIVRVPEVAPLVPEVLGFRMPAHEVEPDQQDRDGVNAREEQDARIPGKTAEVDGKPIKAWLQGPGKAVPRRRNATTENATTSQIIGSAA